MFTLCYMMNWRRKWLHTPVFFSGEFHGQKNLAGCSSWSHKESITTEWLTHMMKKNHEWRVCVCVYMCVFAWMLFVVTFKRGWGKTGADNMTCSTSLLIIKLKTKTKIILSIPFGWQRLTSLTISSLAENASQ